MAAADCLLIVSGVEVQVAFALITFLGYAIGYASEAIAWLTSNNKTSRTQKRAAKRQTGLIDWQTLELCKRFTLQVSTPLSDHSFVHCIIAVISMILATFTKSFLVSSKKSA